MWEWGGGIRSTCAKCDDKKWIPQNIVLAAFAAINGVLPVVVVLIVVVDADAIAKWIKYIWFVFVHDTPKIHIYFHIILDFTVIILFVPQCRNQSLPPSSLVLMPTQNERSHHRCRITTRTRTFWLMLSLFHTHIAYIHVTTDLASTIYPHSAHIQLANGRHTHTRTCVPSPSCYCLFDKALNANPNFNFSLFSSLRFHLFHSISKSRSFAGVCAPFAKRWWQYFSSSSSCSFAYWTLFRFRFFCARGFRRTISHTNKQSYNRARARAFSFLIFMKNKCVCDRCSIIIKFHAINPQKFFRNHK